MGALSGITIIEMAGLGPAPFCGMMLADHGARIIVVHRPGKRPDPRDPLARGREWVEADLKTEEGRAVVMALAAEADGLIEGFRPQVMERLGLGPDVLCAANPRLVYGRMTGWGQTGPLASAPGHDINYIALSGVLGACGRAGEAPVPPMNLVGDFGGGAMMLAFGMVSALLHAHRTGEGQVVDCAMTDGSALLMAMQWGFKAMGFWRDERGVNMLDTGAHFYDVYECADGKFVSVGEIEPQFYANFLEVMGLSDDAEFARQMDVRLWPTLKARLAEQFRTRPRDEWAALFAGGENCFAPVLSMEEAAAHPHNVARGTFVEVDGVKQPAPAPRMSKTPAVRV